jgi:hypothetical protein
MHRISGRCGTLQIITNGRSAIALCPIHAGGLHGSTQHSVRTPHRLDNRKTKQPAKNESHNINRELARHRSYHRPQRGSATLRW